VKIQVVNNDRLKFTYDVPALSKFDKIAFEVYSQQDGDTAILSEQTSYYAWRGVADVAYTLNAHLPPGTYIVKIRTENTGDLSASDFVTYDNNAAGYTVHPGSVTLKVLVKEWNATAPSVPDSVYGSVLGSPASGVTVTITPDSDFRNKKTAVTSADGIAEFGGLYPGLYKTAIEDDPDDEMSRTLAESQLFVFGGQVSHTLHLVSGSQPISLSIGPIPIRRAGASAAIYTGILRWSLPTTTSYSLYFEDVQEISWATRSPRRRMIPIGRIIMKKCRKPLFLPAQ